MAACCSEKWPDLSERRVQVVPHHTWLIFMGFSSYKNGDVTIKNNQNDGKSLGLMECHGISMGCKQQKSSN
jgi:hypothetical protein